jgi:endonuclease-3
LMTKSKAAQILSILKANYPDASCSLDFKTPVQLAVATILSAQSTDERVNMVTPALFKKYRTVRAFAEANQSELEVLIMTVGLYRNKAKSIIAFAQRLRSEFNSIIPRSLEELQTLPGVGRKTANVIKGELYGDPEGIAVDTHVTRLAFRLGFTRHHDPKMIESDLMRLFARSDWVQVSHLLIHHGRAICDARRPRCSVCPLEKICPRRGVNNIA